MTISNPEAMNQAMQYVSSYVEDLIDRYYDEEYGFEEDGWRFVRDLRHFLGTDDH